MHFILSRVLFDIFVIFVFKFISTITICQYNNPSYREIIIIIIIIIISKLPNQNIKLYFFSRSGPGEGIDSRYVDIYLDVAN
jgi:hypothetical protein